MKEVTGRELEALVETGAAVVCDFSASWCGPCRMLAPVLETLSAEFQSQAEFVKVDVDRDGDLAASLGVFSVPDVYIFQGGEVKAHSVGYLPEEELRRFFKENL